jgi:hypothetical protein
VPDNLSTLQTPFYKTVFREEYEADRESRWQLVYQHKVPVGVEVNADEAEDDGSEAA